MIIFFIFIGTVIVQIIHNCNWLIIVNISWLENNSRNLINIVLFINRFMDHENTAKDLSWLSDNKENEKRIRRPKVTAWRKQIQWSDIIWSRKFYLVKKCSFFHSITKHSVNEIRKSANELCEAYPNDLNISLTSEVIQLQWYIDSIGTYDNITQNYFRTDVMAKK